ncbi:hypothetical protein ACJ73_09905 [Blastomyces percursus]|uniref:Uncharacterized protein n=1 Tax=Blastomyces percursus TaxID=1658174 RepID=A0A1J9P1X0_9EURO|nr:hypothetical protein ACJ73_09905 [Blastomyces percursus]
MLSLPQPEDLNENCLAIISTPRHTAPLVWNCYTARNVIHVLKRPLRLGKLHVVDPFLEGLRDAYREDYNMPHIIQLGGIPLQWCFEISFLYEGNSSRSSLQCGDFICYRGKQIGRLDGLFVHELLRGSKRLFAVIIPIHSEFPQIDPILKLPFYKINSGTEIIVGLPVLNYERLYMTPVGNEIYQGHQRLKMADIKNADGVIHCNWNIDFY